MINQSLVEYAVRELFKGKSLDSVSKRVAKKFHGSNNVFLGGIVLVTPDELKKALLDRIADHAIKNANKMKTGMGYFALQGTAEQFNISKDLLAKHISTKQDFNYEASNGLLSEYQK